MEPSSDLRSAFKGSAQLERLESTPVPAAEARPANTGEAPPANSSEAPSVDAWLERRLRVFERALSGLEARQDKTEQDLRRILALLEEAIATHNAKAETILAEPVAEPSAPAAPMPLSVASDPGLASMQKDMRDFIAEARKLVQANMAQSSMAAAPPSRRKGAPRWMAWSAVGCAGALMVTALALGTVAGASVPPEAGLSHRHVTRDAFGRMIALADSGDPRGETVLAFAYLRGEHGAADHAAAARWALAAAEQGEPMAQYLIGAFYRSGDGIAVDPQQAFHWFEASALRGNLKAMHNVAIAYAEGQGTARDPERAAAWFNRAAVEGYTDSQFDLAVLYERGDGVKQNPVAALKWYLVAARSGDKEADARASQLAAEMSVSDVAEAQSLAGYFTPVTADIAANKI